MCARQSCSRLNSEPRRVIHCWAELFITAGQASDTRRVCFGETLALSGLVASIGTVGGAFGNAPAATTIGLYKTEAVRDDSPSRLGPLHRLTDVELLTAEWLHWRNTDRLTHRLGRVPPKRIRGHLLRYETSLISGCIPVIGVHQT